MHQQHQQLSGRPGILVYSAVPGCRQLVTSLYRQLVTLLLWSHIYCIVSFIKENTTGSKSPRFCNLASKVGKRVIAKRDQMFDGGMFFVSIAPIFSVLCLRHIVANFVVVVLPTLNFKYPHLITSLSLLLVTLIPLSNLCNR